LSVVRIVEGYKYSQPDRYRVMGLGKTGGGEGRVLENTEVLHGKPLGYDDLRWMYGMDFGFSEGFTSIARTSEMGGNTLIAEELYYEHGVDLNAIVSILCDQYNFTSIQIECDRAEMVAINELNRHPKALRHGIRFNPVDKPPGSVMGGIEKLRAYDKILIPANCKNAIFEANNYLKKKDKSTGKFTSEPEKKNDHWWDAVRYSRAGKGRRVLAYG